MGEHNGRPCAVNIFAIPVALSHGKWPRGALMSTQPNVSQSIPCRFSISSDCPPQCRRRNTSRHYLPPNDLICIMAHCEWVRSLSTRLPADGRGNQNTSIYGFLAEAESSGRKYFHLHESVACESPRQRERRMHSERCISTLTRTVLLRWKIISESPLVPRPHFVLESSPGTLRVISGSSKISGPADQRAAAGRFDSGIWRGPCSE